MATTMVSIPNRGDDGDLPGGVSPGVTNADRYWQAVLAHDRSFDGSFVYAVRSTGVYCRPSCPSRRPRREQVVFYARADAAESAGFRACRRCGTKPGVSEGAQTALVGKAIDALDAADETAPTLAALSTQLQVSPHQLARGFKRLTGVTPREYTDARRIERLKTGLRNGGTVADAVYEAGYGSSRAVYEHAQSRLGMTPGAYRSGGAGMQIGYTIVDSPLGRLLIAATERGVCSVCLGESNRKLEQALFAEYPKAEIHHDSAGLGPHAGALQKHLAGREPQLTLPVDVQATAFQWGVWRALRDIPYGETRSYSEVARAIGQPKAVRAVARACATNPVAVVIPCHRVVRQDGSPGGYRWGLERKRALLEREKQTGAKVARKGQFKE
ncbi:MAG TPA: bifunctional DNA-binding transcriptional regulator/O6-methylguanine-DNA methyltransferase Ada [Terriglobia bacterium]|nr:bifunctional DNA-binding transcriptional regulator/O6-methylguanine-DNA methyltransferase Ada [Terriglobia bacterium]